jgi:DNA-binding LacI/PurR family transcriptional regulator
MKKLKDVAKLAGVSEATASMAMNNRIGINKETKKRVLEAAKRLNYVPSDIARGLTNKNTKNIGLVVTDIENPFFGSLTKYMDFYAREADYSLLLSISDENPDKEDKIIRNLISKRVDGIVIVPTSTPCDKVPYIDILNDHHIPYIYSTSFYKGGEENCVYTDYEKGSYLLTKYLIDLGHRDIYILISEYAEIAFSALRVNGYKRALTEAGIEVNESAIQRCKRTDFNSGYMTTKRILSGAKPSAIMAINDWLALGAKQAALELGFSIPKDISIAGYDDVLYSYLSEIPLTTVRQNIPELCKTAMEILISRIEKNSQFEFNRIIEPELIIRKSTGVSLKAL